MSNGPELQVVETPHIEREVTIRRGSTDWIVWGDTFTGLYHVPPVELSPATVLDLGANVGLTAAHFGYLWPRARVVAVELDEANLALGRRNAPGATWLHVAVAAEGGVGYYEPRDPPFAMKLGKGAEPVEKMRLDDIVAGAFGAPVDFVKMDVEGAEWELFDVADQWAPWVRRLLVELHPGPEDLVGEAVARLSAAGYEAVPHERHPCAVWAVR